MRKIIVQLAVSLDGFIEGANGEYDWCFTDQDYGMTTFLESIDTILYGRKSYELLLKTGDTSFEKFRTIIFTKQKNVAFKGVEIWSDRLQEKVNTLKNQPGIDIWFFGGAELLTVFLENDWVDELRLALHPIVLGSGKPLFQNLSKRKYLRLTHVQHYATGLIMVHYEKN
jgi:dihydrofolate reductase